MVAFESLLMRRAEGAEFFLAVWVVVTIAGRRRERRCRPRGGDGVESGKGGSLVDMYWKENQTWPCQ
jgi:hypothetical protein